MQFIFQYPEPHGPDGDLLAAGPLGEVAQVAERAGGRRRIPRRRRVGV